MNAQNIWAGNDYAWRGNSRRGERFSLSCQRVRVRRVVKEVLPGNTKASTFVLVKFVDRDTGESIDLPNSVYGIEQKTEDGLYKVRASDFIENWDNVADEYQHLIDKQRIEQAERVLRENEQRERREREQYERQQRLDSVRQFLIDLGINPEWIKEITPDSSSSYYGNKWGIQLSFEEVEQAMKEEVIPSAG